MNGPHRDHGGLHGVHAARHHGLQRHDQRGGGHHHIRGLVRHGAVPAHAVQRDGGVVRRRHGGAAAEHQLTLRHARHVVHGKNGVAREAVKQAVFHHLQRTATAFFGGLKNQVQRAVKRAVLGQVLRGGQQHGGVAVVAAGVHHTVVAAAPVRTRGFGDGQRIHVGAQANGLRGGAPAQLAHHTRAAQAGGDGIAPRGQLSGHQ